MRPLTKLQFQEPNFLSVFVNMINETNSFSICQKYIYFSNMKLGVWNQLCVNLQNRLKSWLVFFKYTCFQFSHLSQKSRIKREVSILQFYFWILYIYGCFSNFHAYYYIWLPLNFSLCRLLYWCHSVLLCNLILSK
jgi:hypothetical protein